MDRSTLILNAAISWRIGHNPGCHSEFVCEETPQLLGKESWSMIKGHLPVASGTDSVSGYASFITLGTV